MLLYLLTWLDRLYKTRNKCVTALYVTVEKRYDSSGSCYASDRKAVRSRHAVSESTANSYDAKRHSVTFTLHHGLLVM